MSKLKKGEPNGKLKKGKSPYDFDQELNDFEPITAIQIIEHLGKCPERFQTVHRTFDHDEDANLWGESSLFARKQYRYLCYSKKSYVVPYYIVESLAIIEEKELPPEGYSVLHRTVDSEQKAWRKRQLCYKLSPADKAPSAVTNIFITTKRMIKAKGVDVIGSINGLTICCIVKSLKQNSELFNKTEWLKSLPSPADDENENRRPSLINENRRTSLNDNRISSLLMNELSKSTSNIKLNGNKNGSFGIMKQASSTSINGKKTNNEDLNEENNYEKIYPPPNLPSRPAPIPPPKRKTSINNSSANNSIDNYATIKLHTELEGVPFVFNPLLNSMNLQNMLNIPHLKQRTSEEIDKEFSYNFRLERQTSSS